MKILIIDNYDSFTYNLYQQLARLSGTRPRVVTNDGARLQDIEAWQPTHIVISPGPGRPDRELDFGVCGEVLTHWEGPVLGVCLGYQGLAHFHGGRVVAAAQVMHGRTSSVMHEGDPLFAGVPSGFTAVRYHSLIVDDQLPETLQPIAWTPDGVLMGLRHKSRPHVGIQFHPESICTQYGSHVIANFLGLSEPRPPLPPTSPPAPLRASGAWIIRYRKLEGRYDPETVFNKLYAHRRHAFWLDSSLVRDNLARYSYMGALEGPASYLVTYRMDGRRLEKMDSDGNVTACRESIFSFLRRELAEKRVNTPDLPFPYHAGFAGYFGYELKAECGGDAMHASPHPDAAFLFADRTAVFDGKTGACWLTALVQAGAETDAEHWFDATERKLSMPAPTGVAPADHPTTSEFKLSRDRNGYLADIETCLAKIQAGESYEVCLTNRLVAPPLEPFRYYCILRRVNPAPYAAFLRLGDELAVCCSSPEQFLRIGAHGHICTKPIKGTLARQDNPAADRQAALSLADSVKDRSENLMIVDLLRNDLGRVSEIGSVTVPKLMDVESYATVHQLVSTITSRPRADADVIGIIEAAFPGGSMTGAPKVRTMQIIDSLETDARGIYSGSIGFLSLDGAAELNIVIRTAVCTPLETTVGIGGAIVALSDPEEEFAEILLKAVAPARACAMALGQSTEPGILGAQPDATPVVAN
ncbi:MAG: aminodeoxychorismate synthase component I [Acidobacteriota bacterium]|nr:aminodeoxychorismate synthase component I [Acidobacteriota bacterium]